MIWKVVYRFGVSNREDSVLEIFGEEINVLVKSTAVCWNLEICCSIVLSSPYNL